MADEVTYTGLTDAQFAVLKMYCKIDQTVEDDMLGILASNAESQIANAIQTGLTPESLLSEPLYRDRFFTAVMKQVKEDYDYRGEGAEIMRYQLIEPVANIVNQLRAEVPDENE